ncbi:MAG: carboxypeptidase regulatory-like domain-containing protein, partial [Thermoplasmata archaeon]
PNQYDEAGYNWLATQDTNLPLYQRPALVSWWDYGFQTLGEGDHPVVADNFQDGIDPSGAFLLSQNESEAIAVLTVELLASEQTATHQPDLPASLNSLLAADGVGLPEFHTLLVNTSLDVPLVIAHPERYLPVNAANLDPTNAMYMATSWFLADTLSLAQVAHLYDDVQAYTGWSIRYDMVDSRLIPFSGSDTGIYYAPADLTDRQIDSGGNPTAFFNVSVVGSDGNTYQEGHVPADVSAVNYNINYHAAFYNSMIYRTYFGYNGTDTGQSAGIPGLSGSLQGAHPEPGWMLEHFQVVYRTAYYCPYANPNDHPNCFVAENLPTADASAAASNGTGTVDNSASSYFNGGEAILEYYPGETLSGVVELPNGAPVSDAIVTVDDSWGIPHMAVLTGSDGSFQVVMPPGNDTLNVTTGSVDGLTEQGTTVFDSIPMYISPAYALSDNAPSGVKNIVLRPASVTGEVYWNTANNSSYDPALDSVISGAMVNLWGAGLVTHQIASDASGAFDLAGVSPGVYNFSVTYGGTNYTQSNLYLSPGTVSNQSLGLSPGSVSGFVVLASGTAASGATVTLTAASGAAESVTTNATGAFELENLGRGNYTARARLAAQHLGSIPIPVSLASTGAKARLNLTLTGVGTFELSVLHAGAPVSGFPVRFTPVVSAAGAAAVINVSTAVTSTTGPNSTLFRTPGNGTIVGTLPSGSYEIYSVGLLNGKPFAALGNATVTSAHTVIPFAPLELVPAYSVHGRTPPPSSAISPTEITVTAYAPDGNSVSAFDNESGDWLMLLPAGTYGLSATVPTTSSGSAEMGLTTLAVSGDTSVSLSLQPATVLHTTLGSYEGGGGLYPAVGARFTVTLQPTGGYATGISDPAGNVTVLIPAGLPTSESLCVNVSSVGFLPYQQCGLSPQSAAALSPITLTLRTVPLRIDFTGVSSGVPIRLNVTATAPPGVSQVLIGGPTFALSLVPGNYTVSAWAEVPGQTGLYRPTEMLNLTVALASVAQSYSISLLREIPSKGTLDLPKGLSTGSVRVELSAPSVNLNVSGLSFITGFLAPPGTYTALAEATGGSNVTYANLTRVSINATGVLTPRLDLTRPAGILNGIVRLETGGLLNGTFPLALVTASGLTIGALSVFGAFSIGLPIGTVVHPALNVTVLYTGVSGVPQKIVYRTESSPSCAVTSVLSNCTIVLLTTNIPIDLEGTATYPSYPGPLSGTVEFVGPLPGLAATTVPLTSGAFSAALAPGVYDAYAVAQVGGVALASLGRVVVESYPTVEIPLILGPTWTDTVTLLAPSSGGAATANLTFSGPEGSSLPLSDEPVGPPMAFALPPGTWSVQANSTARPYGVLTPTAASQTVALIQGNAATALTLVPVYTRQVDFSLEGVTSQRVLPGATVSFSFAIMDTGDTPLDLHLIGTPSTWTFNFTPANVTVGVSASNRTASGEVVIHLPANTPTAVPPIELEALLPNGDVLGVASPSPTITVEPAYGLRIGASPRLGTVGTNSATLPFWVLDTGNTVETVALTLPAQTRLAGLGWTTRVMSGTTPVVGPVTLQPGTNTSYDVELTAGALPPPNPGSVQVVATVLNVSGTQPGSVVLTVSNLPVEISNDTLVVTGPSVGSPPAYPAWLLEVLVFVPAFAAVAVAASFRWYRNRRWHR